MRRLLVSTLLVGLTAAPALAQAPASTAASLASTPASRAAIARAAAGLQEASVPAPAAAPSKPYTMTAGADVASAYLFRGIFQEDQGFIMQPYVDFGFDVAEGVKVNAGSWNSTHSGPSGSSPFDGPWYETDAYGSVTFSAGKFSPGLLFTSYNSPNNVFNTVNELAGVFTYDDSDRPVAFSPKAVLAFELSGQADGGDNTGIYLELGVRPSFATGTPVSIAVPVKVGLSLKDYYESFAGNDSNTLGYFTTGLAASVPLPGRGPVSWELHGGVDFYWLGDNMKLLNGGDRFKPVGLVGLALTY